MAEERTDIATMRDWIRRWGRLHLADPNVTSVGVGIKETGGEPTGEVCIQFTVREKLAPAALEAAATRALPEKLRIQTVTVPTDVVERSFVPAHRVVPEAASDERTERLDPVRPGLSISHPTVSAGTLGAIVHDLRSGEPVMLSNWHVLHGPAGAIGDEVLQPGTHDDNSGDPRNVVGRLLRSHLGAAGDGALASLEHRGADPSILALEVVPEEIADPELGDRVVKSGRTTAVSHGVVSRVHVMVALDYGDGAGERSIGGFEIAPDPRREAEQNSLSDGGDSGAAWMLKSGNGRTSTVLGGIHFAGSDTPDGRERALANYASSLRDKLGFSLSPATAAARAAQEVAARGYDPDFLLHPVVPPELSQAHREDAARLDGEVLIPYTHFSLVQSASRRFARFVAWNIDGGRLRRIDRAGQRFRLDPRLPEEVQVGEDLYRGNDLDRGHIARRADLTWGTDAEARRANEDSFLFPNIAAQMARYNQSGRGGVWGQVENSLFEQVEVQQLRASVVGGPILAEHYLEYRGVQIPGAFFKVVYYVVGEELRAQALLLAQDLTGLQRLDLSSSSTYIVDLADLEERTGLAFAPAADGRTDSGAAPTQAAGPVLLESADDIPW